MLRLGKAWDVRRFPHPRDVEPAHTFHEQTLLLGAQSKVLGNDRTFENPLGLGGLINLPTGFMLQEKEWLSFKGFNARVT